ncbi:MAG TPA: hypothetical protein VEZ90_18315, partial [Blastocatellia bacterium]|nr:hypothetical protein [Blastocatellia bacterium]
MLGIKMKSVAFVLGLIMLMATAAVARQESSDKSKADQAKTQETQSSRGPNENPTAGLKTKVFEIKYGSPRNIAEVIGPLGSGNAWAKTSISMDYHT